jgi:hypothetical protein
LSSCCSGFWWEGVAEWSALRRGTAEYAREGLELEFERKGLEGGHGRGYTVNGGKRGNRNWSGERRSVVCAGIRGADGRMLSMRADPGRHRRSGGVSILDARATCSLPLTTSLSLSSWKWKPLNSVNSIKQS